MQHGSLFGTNIGADAAFNAVKQEFISGFLKHPELAALGQLTGEEPGRTMSDADAAIDAGVRGEAFGLSCGLKNQGIGIFAHRSVRAE